MKGTSNNYEHSKHKYLVSTGLSLHETAHQFKDRYDVGLLNEASPPALELVPAATISTLPLDRADIILPFVL